MLVWGNAGLGEARRGEARRGAPPLPLDPTLHPHPTHLHLKRPARLTILGTSWCREANMTELVPPLLRVGRARQGGAGATQLAQA